MTKETLAVMFIPPSVNSLLLQKIMEAEEKLAPEMDWNVKLIEQSGIPLGMTFIPKFPLLQGCPRGMDCKLCENTGIKCNKKGVIYRATCKWCKHQSDSLTDEVNVVHNMPHDEATTAGMDDLNNDHVRGWDVNGLLVWMK